MIYFKSQHKEWRFESILIGYSMARSYDAMRYDSNVSVLCDVSTAIIKDGSIALIPVCYTTW